MASCGNGIAAWQRNQKNRRRQMAARRRNVHHRQWRGINGGYINGGIEENSCGIEQLAGAIMSALNGGGGWRKYRKWRRRRRHRGGGQWHVIISEAYKIAVNVAAAAAANGSANGERRRGKWRLS